MISFYPSTPLKRRRMSICLGDVYILSVPIQKQKKADSRSAAARGSIDDHRSLTFLTNNNNLNPTSWIFRVKTSKKMTERQKLSCEDPRAFN